MTTLNITTNSPLPDATVGEPYSVQLAAEGGDGTYAWGVVMPIADNKKVLTVTNRAGAVIEAARAGILEIKDYRDRLVADGASLASAPYTIGQLNAWILAFEAQVTTGLTDDIVAGIVPSHRGEAL